VAVKNGYKESQDMAIVNMIKVLRDYGFLPKDINPAKSALAFATFSPDQYKALGTHFTTWDRSALNPSISKEQGLGHALEALVKSIAPSHNPGEDILELGLDEVFASGTGKDLQDQLADAIWHHIDEIKERADKFMTERHAIDSVSVDDINIAGVPVASMWHPANMKLAAGPVSKFLEETWEKLPKTSNAVSLKDALLKRLGIPVGSVHANPKYSEDLNKYFSPFSDLANFVRGSGDLRDFADDFLFSGKGRKELVQSVKDGLVTVSVGSRTFDAGKVADLTALADSLRPNMKTVLLSDAGTKMVFDEKNWFRSPLFTSFVNDLESKTGIKLFTNTPEGTVDNVLRAISEKEVDGTSTFIKKLDAAKDLSGVKDEYFEGRLMKSGIDGKTSKELSAIVNGYNIRNRLAKFVSSTEKVFEDDGLIRTPAILEDFSKIFASSMGLDDVKIKNVKLNAELLPVYEIFQESSDEPVALGQVIGFSNGETAERINTKILDIKTAYNDAGFSILDEGNEGLKLSAEFTYNDKDYRININGREHTVEELEKPAIISAKDPSVENMKSEDIITSKC
jgi:hypothetical protein